MRERGRPAPQRWHGKVLACTDPTATARQVVEWYEVRWQIEIFFREIKSRLQFGCYVLQKFAAVERARGLRLHLSVENRTAEDGCATQRRRNPRERT